MVDGKLTPESILDAAEDVLRRFGPAKMSVVDVARALNVSHGTIYRHFPSKAALREAVTRRWLARVSAPLRLLASEPGDEPAVARLRRWMARLVSIKRNKVLDDPELFATYHALAEGSRDAVRRHVDELVDQLAQIIARGLESGELHTPDGDPVAAAQALFTATIKFHHPAFASHWSDPGINETLERVLDLVIAGLGRG